MIRNPHLLQQFEDDEIRREPKGYAENVEVFRAMLRHAVAMGAFDEDDWRRDVEPDIKVARTINALRL